jgi:hypothetical protein
MVSIDMVTKMLPIVMTVINKKSQIGIKIQHHFRFDWRVAWGSPLKKRQLKENGRKKYFILFENRSRSKEIFVASMKNFLESVIGNALLLSLSPLQIFPPSPSSPFCFTF